MFSPWFFTGGPGGGPLPKLLVLSGIRLLVAFSLFPALGGRWTLARVGALGALLTLLPAWPLIVAGGGGGGWPDLRAGGGISPVSLLLGEVLVGALLGGVCWLVIFSLEGVLLHILGADGYRPVPCPGTRGVPPVHPPQAGGNRLVSLLILFFATFYLWRGGHRVVILSLVNSLRWLPPGAGAHLLLSLGGVGTGVGGTPPAVYLLSLMGQLTSLGMCLLLPGLGLLVPVQLLSGIIFSRAPYRLDDWGGAGAISLILSFVLCLLLTGFALPLLAELVLQWNGEAFEYLRALW